MSLGTRLIQLYNLIPTITWEEPRNGVTFADKLLIVTNSDCMYIQLGEASHCSDIQVKPHTAQISRWSLILLRYPGKASHCSDIQVKCHTALILYEVKSHTARILYVYPGEASHCSDTVCISRWSLTLLRYRVAENFHGRKLLQISWFCGYEIFSEIWGHGIFCGTSEQSTKVFSAKILFPSICECFLPRKFPLYSAIVSVWMQHT